MTENVIKCGTCFEAGTETAATTRIRIELRPRHCSHTVPMCERHARIVLAQNLPNVTRRAL